MKNMTDTELAAAERKHDDMFNEGGEGYNPYTDEINDRLRRSSVKLPRTAADVVYELANTYEPEKVAALRAELSTF